MNSVVLSRCRLLSLLCLSTLLVAGARLRVQGQSAPLWVSPYVIAPYNTARQLMLDSMGNPYLWSEFSIPDVAYLPEVVKYDPNGNYLWDREFADENGVVGYISQMALDLSGNLLITGERGNTPMTMKADLSANLLWTGLGDPILGYGYTSHAPLYLVATDSARNVLSTAQMYFADTSSYEIVLVKYDPNGRELWRKRIRNGGQSRANAIAIDSQGNIVLAGYTNDGTNGFDMLVVRLDPNGNTLWLRQVAGPLATGFDELYSLALDGADNILVAGETANSDGTNYWRDSVLLKYATDGTLAWQKKFQGYNGVSFNRAKVVVDGQSNVLFAAQISNQDYAVLYKYAPDGSYQWGLSYAIRRDGASYDEAYSLPVAVDTAGYVSTLGSLSSTATQSDFVTRRFAPDGRLIWQRRYDHESGNNDQHASLIPDLSGAVYVAGTSYPTDTSGGWYSESLLLKYGPRAQTGLTALPVSGILNQMAAFTANLKHQDYTEQSDLYRFLINSLPNKPLLFKVNGLILGTTQTKRASSYGQNPAGLFARIPNWLPLGNNTLTIEFPGDNEYLPCSTTVPLRVRAATAMRVGNRAAIIGQSLSLAANLRSTSYTPNVRVVGKTVRFRVGSVILGTGVTNAGGDAIATIVLPDTLPAGVNTLVAEFDGDDQYAATSATGTLTVTGASTALRGSDRTGAIGQLIGFAANLRNSSVTPNVRVEGRLVTFAVGTVVIGSAITDTNGDALLAARLPEAIGAGTLTLTTSFAGDVAYNASSTTSVLTVSKANTALRVGNRTGQRNVSITLAANLRNASANPNLRVAGKTLTFRVGNTTLGTAVTDADGEARLTVTLPNTLPIGNNVLTVQFAGDAAYNAASATGTLTVNS